MAGKYEVVFLYPSGAIGARVLNCGASHTAWTASGRHPGFMKIKLIRRRNACSAYFQGCCGRCCARTGTDCLCPGRRERAQRVGNDAGIRQRHKHRRAGKLGPRRSWRRHDQRDEIKVTVGAPDFISYNALTPQTYSHLQLGHHRPAPGRLLLLRHRRGDLPEQGPGLLREGQRRSADHQVHDQPRGQVVRWHPDHHRRRGPGLGHAEREPERTDDKGKPSSSTRSPQTSATPCPRAPRATPTARNSPSPSRTPTRTGRSRPWMTQPGTRGGQAGRHVHRRAG